MSDESAWFDHLVAEAERDLVFLWNIEAGSFGGPPRPVRGPEVMAAIRHLLSRGCTVGFGDPDTPEWRVPEELRVSSEALPRVVLKLLRTRPREYEFLVFAVRNHLNATS